MASGTFLSSGTCITGYNNIYDGYLKAYERALTGAVGQCTGILVIDVGGSSYTGAYSGTLDFQNQLFYNTMINAILSSKNKYYNSSGCC